MSRRLVLAAAVSLAALSVTIGAATALEVSSQQQSARQVSRKVVGPWGVLGWVTPGGVGYCSAERAIGQFQVGFLRRKDAFGLIVLSPTWQLQKTGNYPVKLSVAGVTSRTVPARVMGSQLILVDLGSDLNEMRRMAAGQTLNVVAADTEIAIPLDSFAEALTELETCIAQAPQPGQASPPAQPSQPAQQPPPSQDPQPQQPGLPIPFPGTPGSKMPQ